MTAFAFDILAALTGSGAKPGVGASGASGMDGVAGVFEALVAGMVAQQQGEGAGTAEGEAAAATPPLPAASPLAPKTRIAQGGLPLFDAADAQPALSSGLLDETKAAELAGAEAVVAQVAPAAEITVAAVEPQVQSVGKTPVAADTAVDPTIAAASAETVLAEAQAVTAPEQRFAAASAQTADQPVADVAPRRAPYARRELPDLSNGVKVATSDAPAAKPVEAEPAPTAAEPSVRPAAPATATQVATSPELVSVTARVVEPKAAEPRAAPSTSPTTVKAEATELATLAPVEALEAVAPEAPVEVLPEALPEDAAPAETFAAQLADAAEAPPPPSAPRRANRAEPAARPSLDTAPVEAARPDAKVASINASTRADAPSAAHVAAAPIAPDPAGPTATAAAPDVAAADAIVAPPSGHAEPISHAAATADPAAVVRGSPETVAKLASDIVRKLEGKSTKFDVQLDPLGLGKVDVSVEINADGRLTAALSFESAQAAADLRGRAVELRQALEKAGFDLTDSSLSFDMSNQGGGAERHQAGERFAAWTSRAFQTVQTGLDQADALLAASSYSRSPAGGVDIRI